MRKGIVLERSFEEVSTKLRKIKKEKDLKPEIGSKKGIVLERLLDEVLIGLPKIKSEKNFNPEGGSKMNRTRNKRTRLSFDRPSPYPLPKGLLIGFYGK